MWFDSHCHLHLCETGTPEEIVDRARAAGVTQLLTVGIDVESSARSIDLAADDGVHAAVGVHPNSSEGWSRGHLSALEELAGHDRVVAIGESGLDFYRDDAARDVQLAAFRDHIDLAKRSAKTLVIHTRDSIDVALEVLSEAKPPERLIFHCWSGAQTQLVAALELGAYISFAGNVSFKTADDLRAAAAAVPSDRLLVETDSPYLTPVPNRGKPNEPRQVAFVGAAVAQARGIPVPELARITSENARQAFGL